MEKEYLAIALTNYGWQQELPDTFISKSGAVSITLGAAFATIHVHGNVHSSALYMECAVNRQQRTISLGAVEIKAQN